ncbi:MAG: Stp1/IreP family PP2C-type Ser/Thr phosphatase [Ardenticatenaceae bacterium]
MREKQHSHVSVTTCSLADTGHRRSQQEDSLGYVNIPLGEKTVALHRGHLYVVADGVGGAKGGEIASSIAVQTIIENYYTVPGSSVESTLKNAILRAHEQIRAESQKHDLHKMRTTVVCAVIRGANLTVAHLGDSRAYVLREGELIRLTSDHSVVQELIDTQELSKEEASYHPEKHVITRALGSFATIEVEVSSFAISPGDRLLLCSDGLHDELSEEEMQRLLATDGNSTAICTALVEQANLAGGKDNIGVIVTDVDGIDSAPGFRAYPHLPPTQFGRIKPFSHMKLAYLEAESEEVAKQPPSWWQRQQPNWVLAVTTIIFVTMLILQTLWFQSAYGSGGGNRKGWPLQDSTPPATNTLDVLVIPTSASPESTKTPPPSSTPVSTSETEN